MEPIPMAEAAQRIRMERKSLRLTQQELADLAGLSDRTVRTIEQGKASPSIGALLAVLNVLGLRLEVH